MNYHSGLTTTRTYDCVGSDGGARSEDERMDGKLAQYRESNLGLGV